MPTNEDEKKAHSLTRSFLNAPHTSGSNQGKRGVISPFLSLCLVSASCDVKEERKTGVERRRKNTFYPHVCARMEA